MKFTALLLCLFSMGLRAQTPPADLLAGSWINDNADTGGMTEVVVRHEGSRILVHAWGRCTPTDCDWGEIAADTYNGYLIANWDHGFSMVRMQLIPLPDGRLLMVLRGSNDRKPELPSYRWFSMSSDGGRRWTTPVPWTYTDGERFCSPSSCSRLLRHSSGRLFWLGNITPTNPRGNRPRYPFVIGEVDLRTGLLRRDTVRTIDTLQDGEDTRLSLSNFYAREDRRTREIAVHMTRLFAGGTQPWSGDAYVYYVPV